MRPPYNTHAHMHMQVATDKKKLVEDEATMALQSLVREREMAALASEEPPPGGQGPGSRVQGTPRESPENIHRAAASKCYLSLLEMCDTVSVPGISPVQLAAFTCESSDLVRAAKAIADGVQAARPADYRVVG